jgi:hypothetical protein
MSKEKREVRKTGTKPRHEKPQSSTSPTPRHEAPRVAIERGTPQGCGGTEQTEEY